GSRGGTASRLGRSLLSATQQWQYRRTTARRGGHRRTRWGSRPDARFAPTRRVPRQISGSPSTVRDLLEQMTDHVGVEKVVIQNMIEDPDDRIRSYELIADGVGLSAGDS